MRAKAGRDSVFVCACVCISNRACTVVCLCSSVSVFDRVPAPLCHVAQLQTRARLLEHTQPHTDSNREGKGREGK